MSQAKAVLGELPAHVSAPDPQIYWSDNYVVLDFETTTEFKGSPLVDGNRIILACWSEPRSENVGREHRSSTDGGRNRTMRFCFGSEYDLGELTDAIHRSDFVVAHNAKFELGWLKRAGVDLHKVVSFDTMLAEYVLGGNTYALQQLSLNMCLSRHGLSPKEDTVGRMLKAGIKTEDIPESWLLTYCKRDVGAAEELFLSQRQQLRERGLEAICYQRNLVTPALTDLEFNGLQLDVAEVENLTKVMEEEYARKTAELQDFCEGASPSSPKQKREFIFGVLGFDVPRDYRGNPLLTKSGEPSVAADVLLRLRARNKRQQRFLDLHREWSALHSDVTKYLRKFRDCCTEAGGRIIGQFNQAATRTHRFSSSGLEYRVQLQNLNRRFKPLFTARHAGWNVAEADGAQLEFRVATHLGRDRVALEDIVKGVDIHAYTASIIGCSRQDAKAHTFKPLYGGSSGTEAERRYYEAFAEKYSGIADTQRGWVKRVLNSKELKTEWGLTYYWPDTRMTKSGYITNTTSIYNYPVQAFATAEIIPIALVCAWHRMKDWTGFLVNTVHDSIIAELPDEELEAWHEVAKQCLIEDSYKLVETLYGVKLTVPLGAGVTVGSHWASAEAKDSEVVYEADEALWKDSAREEGMWND